MIYDKICLYFRPELILLILPLIIIIAILNMSAILNEKWIGYIVFILSIILSTVYTFAVSSIITILDIIIAVIISIIIAFLIGASSLHFYERWELLKKK